MARPEQFEVFRAKRSRHPTTPIITIQKKGVLALNRAAHELLGSPPAAHLLYARDGRAIGVRAAPPDDDYAYPLRTPKGGTARHISGAGYLKHYGIPIGRRVHLAASLEGDTLVARLPSP